MMANLDNNRWVTTAGEGKATFIAKDDSGRVATALLLGKGEHNKDYDVTGQLISQHEICNMISELSGINYEYITLNDEKNSNSGICEYFYDYTILGFLGVIKQWFENDASIPPKEMALILTKVEAYRIQANT